MTHLSAKAVADALSTASTAIGTSAVGVVTGVVTIATALTGTQQTSFASAILASGITIGSLGTSISTLNGTMTTGGLLTNATSLATYLGQAGTAATAFATLVGGLKITIPAITPAVTPATAPVVTPVTTATPVITPTVPPVKVDTYAAAYAESKAKGSAFSDYATFESALLASAPSTLEMARIMTGYNADSDIFKAYRSIKGYAVGTSYVPNDQLAMIHQGEEITPRPYVDAQRSDREETNRLLEQLLKSNADLRAEVAELRKSADKTTENTGNSANMLNRVTRNGRAMQTEVFV